MKTWLSLVTVLLVSCASGLPQQGNKIGVEEAAKWVADNPQVQVLDVRRPDEFKGGHLKEAILVTWGDKDFERQALAKLSKDKPVLVYCRSGRRSTAASEVLTGLGFKQLRNLEGGITAWQEAGKAVTK